MGPIGGGVQGGSRLAPIKSAPKPQAPSVPKLPAKPSPASGGGRVGPAMPPTGGGSMGPALPPAPPNFSQIGNAITGGGIKVTGPTPPPVGPAPSSGLPSNLSPFVKNSSVSSPGLPPAPPNIPLPQRPIGINSPITPMSPMGAGAAKPPLMPGKPGGF